MSKENLRDLWRSILTNGSDLSPADSVLHELQRYSGKPMEIVEALAADPAYLTKDKWESRDRRTAEDLQDFYDSVTNWVYGTLAYHARQVDIKGPPLPVDVADFLRDRQPGHMLDFGSGVATASLFFAELGWRVTAADISGPLLDFARWRIEDRGAPIELLDLRHTQLPDATFDVICAFNTMVHVHDPEATIRDLHRALKPNGLLIFDIGTRPKSADMPWHLSETEYPTLRTVRRLGFRAEPSLGMLHVFRKAEMSAVRRSLVGAYDAARYSRAGSLPGRVSRRLRTHRPAATKVATISSTMAAAAAAAAAVMAVAAD